MRTLILIFFFTMLTLMASESFGQVIPKEMYLTHTIREGQRVKDIAIMYQANYERFAYINKTTLERGYKVGDELKIPITEISAIHFIYRDSTKKSYDNNLFKVVTNDSNKNNQIVVDNEQMDSVELVLNTSELSYQIEIKFKNGYVTVLSGSDDIRNILASVNRMNESRRDINYALNKFQFF